MADFEALSCSPAPRPQRQRPGRTDRDDRHHGVFGAASADAVAVPGDAVVAIAVQAQPGGTERLAQLSRVVLIERRAGLLERRIG